jgi:putative SOS response-associated peptidase YedK
MHLGLDPLPYLWYKRTVQLGRAGMMKFLNKEKSDIILSYCVATRKQRREVPKFHDCYMIILNILKTDVRLEEQQKQIDELNRQIAEMEKNN